MSARQERALSLFPLNTVLFPGGRLPLRIFEQRYMEMAKTCLREDSAFGVCLIREGSEVGAPAVPVAIGCSARIEHWDMQQLGVLNVLARGEQRFRILQHRIEPGGLARADIEWLPADADCPLPPDCAPCGHLLRNAFERLASSPRPGDFDSSSWVSARLAEILPLPLATKQELLEERDAKARLLRVKALLAQAGLLREVS